MRYPAGFSFVEILATVAILALMATAAVPYLELVVTRQKEAELRRDLRELREAIDAYKKATDEGRIPKLIDESGYPKQLEDLVNGIADAKDPTKRKIYFLRRLPRDPMLPNPEVSAAQTWGLRSYESPPDQPREGADVFDVYSKSEQKGLDGVPYNQW
jgi:general secretion pathway protein G